MEEAECEQNFGAEGEESCPYDPNLVCTLQGDVDPAPVVCGECEYVNICTGAYCDDPLLSGWYQFACTQAL